MCYDEEQQLLLEEKKGKVPSSTDQLCCKKQCMTWVTRNNNNVVTAYIVACLCVLGSCTSTICAQLLDKVVPMFELNAFRFVSQMVISLGFALPTNTTLQVERNQWLQLLLIILVYTAYSVMYFTATTFIPVATLSGLENTSVIITVVIISLCTRTRNQTHVYVAAFLSLVGLLMLTQPHWLVGDAFSRWEHLLVSIVLLYA